MSFFDWVELCSFRNEHYKGDCKVTLGDVLGGTIGSTHAHIFGAETKIVCDLEDLFCEHVLGSTGTLGKLLGTGVSGIGGAATWIYGSNLSATYIGPKIDICRAETITRSAPNFKKNAIENDDDLDKKTAIAIKSLSMAMCAVALAFDIAIYCVTLQKNSEETVEWLKICCYTLIGRLMAVLKDIEVKGTWAEFAKEWVDVAKFLRKQLSQSLQSNPKSPDLAMGLVEIEMVELVSAVGYAENAIEED